ncbi:MAG TPA: hypothetical protein IGS37_12185 [Synechococcales cyanobacterium M55_K2018_004]|nr:hypothetical protein [Synechococcales cyanobacterium M55_K2018_004]
MVETAVFLLRGVLHILQLLLVPLCFVLAWVIMALTAWNLWSALRDSVARAQQMHQIPCANCRFFSGNYQIKCAVHPDIALSEQAIDCKDYEPTDSMTCSP